MRTLSPWLRTLIAGAFTLGIILRFVNLDKKIFWIDEVSTAWVVSGYTRTEVEQHTVNGSVLHAADILRYQINDRDRNTLDTIRVLATGDAVHPPAYYIILRLWRDRFGSSVVATRMVSALISLAILPCAYFLCVELFGSALIGWIAVALIALSPFHLYYAQEAREYGMWGVLTLLSSLALLRARRLNTFPQWLLYTVTVAIGLYSSLLFVGVFAAHIAFMVYTGSGSDRALRKFTLSLVPALIAFAPWLWTVAKHLREVSMGLAWTTTKVTALLYWGHVLSGLGGLFVWSTWSFQRSVFLGVAVFALVVYSFWFVARQESRSAWLFLALLALIPALPFAISDLVLGGHRMLISRYLEPFYLSVEISVACLFARHLVSPTRAPGAARLWQTGFAALLFASALSCIIESWHTSAWDSNRNAYAEKFARILNTESTPLLISDDYRSNILDVSVISRLLAPNVGVEIEKDPQLPSIRGYHDLFLLNPSPVLLNNVNTKVGYTPQPMSPNIGFPIYVLRQTMPP